MRICASELPPLEGSRQFLADMQTTLPHSCSSIPNDGFVDTSIVETSHVAIGMFRCPAGYRSFRDTGPTERCLVVFPRTAVWIRHEGSRAFLADPLVATIYNAEQRYERFVESPQGDCCDWFGVSTELAREIAGAFDARAGDATRPFAFEWADSPAPLYLRQRLVLHRAMAGELDRLEIEEATMAIVASVIAVAYHATRRTTPTHASRATRHRELADAARAELLRTLQTNHSVHELARTLATSPFHLCRVFRSCTGRTLHGHRMELRVRLALEAFEDMGRASNLSAIAHDLGFCSHAHFVGAMRRHAGMAPSRVRALLRAARAPSHGSCIDSPSGACF